MSTLRDELINGPLAAQIAPLLVSADDVSIAAILNNKNIPVVGTINVNEFAIWAAATGMRAAIQAQADNALSPLRSIALTLLDLLQGNLHPESLNLGLPGNVAMLNAWVNAGLLSQENHDNLIALATNQISRAQQLGISITDVDIRREIWNDDGTRKL